MFLEAFVETKAGIGIALLAIFQPFFFYWVLGIGKMAKTHNAGKLNTGIEHLPFSSWYSGSWFGLLTGITTAYIIFEAPSIATDIRRGEWETLIYQVLFIILLMLIPNGMWQLEKKKGKQFSKFWWSGVASCLVSGLFLGVILRGNW